MINDKVKGDRIGFDNNKKVVESQKMSKHTINALSLLSNVGGTISEETSEVYCADMKNLHQRHLQVSFKTSRYHRLPDRQPLKKDDDKTVKSVKERIKDLEINDKKLVNVKNVIKRGKCSISPNKMTKTDKKTDRKCDKRSPVLDSGKRKTKRSLDKKKLEVEG